MFQILKLSPMAVVIFNYTGNILAFANSLNLTPHVIPLPPQLPFSTGANWECVKNAREYQYKDRPSLCKGAWSQAQPGHAGASKQVYPWTDSESCSPFNIALMCILKDNTVSFILVYYWYRAVLCMPFTNIHYIYAHTSCRPKGTDEGNRRARGLAILAQPLPERADAGRYRPCIPASEARSKA